MKTAHFRRVIFIVSLALVCSVSASPDFSPPPTTEQSQLVSLSSKIQNLWNLLAQLESKQAQAQVVENASSQTNALRITIEGLNSQISTELQLYLSAGSSSKPTHEAKLLSLTKERKIPFLALMRVDPAVALLVVLSEDVRSKLPLAVMAQVEQPVSDQGAIEIRVIDYLDNSSELIYKMKSNSGGALLTLHFAELNTELNSGDQIQISALKLGNDLLVVDESAGMEMLSAANAPSVIGERKTLVVLANFTDNRSEFLTPAQVHDIFSTYAVE